MMLYGSLYLCLAFGTVTGKINAQVPVPQLTSTPPPIAATCEAMSAAFSHLAKNLEAVSLHAKSAAYNAKGLGYFSPGKYFHGVEDDYSTVREIAADSVRTEIAVSRGLAGSTLDASGRPLLTADDSALRSMFRYAATALAYERAVNSKNLTEEWSLGLAGMSLWPSPEIVCNTCAYASSPTAEANAAIAAGNTIIAEQNAAASVSRARLTVGEVRAMLDNATPSIISIEDALVAPTQTWNAACPT